MPTPGAGAPKRYRRVITFGTFDLLHVGHVRIVQRAAALGDELYVGVSSDALNHRKKGRFPIYTEADRMEIVRGLKGVTDVFLEESLEQKREYVLRWRADCLVMGDDWKGRFDELSDVCDVVYLPRTEHISTTSVKDSITANRGEGVR